MLRKVRRATGGSSHKLLLKSGILVAIAHFCISAASGQQDRGELELQRAREFTGKGLYDSSIVHYRIARDYYQPSVRRDRYYYCLAGIADSFIRQSEFGPADTLLRNALAGVRSELGEENKVTAEIYLLTGFLRTYQNRYVEAMDLCDRALQTWILLEGEKSERVAATYYQIGWLTYRKGEFDAAMKYLENARTIQEQMADLARVSLANTLVLIGNVDDLRSEPSKAIECYLRALSILSEAGLAESPASGFCSHFLALSYRHLGKLEDAVACQKNTLRIYRKIYPKSHVNLASSLAQLADYYAENGDYDLALQCYQESGSIFRSLVGPKHSTLSEVQRKIAGLYALRGRFDEALTLYLSVASREAQDFGSANPELGVLFQEIGEIYRKKGEFHRALRFYSRALDLRNSIHTSGERSDLIEILHGEGQTYMSLGNINQAEAILRKCTGMRDFALSRNPTLKSSIFETMARVSVRRGDLLVSARLYQKALISLCPEFCDTSLAKNPDVPNYLYCRDYIRLITGKAAVLVLHGIRGRLGMADLKAALSAYELASDALRELRNSYKSEDSKLVLQQEGAEVYSAGMAVAILILNKTGDASAKDAAISFSERSKAQVLREALERASVRHFAGIPDTLLEEEQRLRTGLTNLLKRPEWTLQHADSASTSVLRTAILDKNWLIERLEDSLAILNPRFRKMFDDIQPANAAVLQGALDSETCLIEYNVTRSSFYAFVARKGSFDIVELGKPNDVDSLAKELRHGLRTMNDEEYLIAARRLHALLIHPIESRLAGVKRLVVVPDGPLYYLPFEVLLSRDDSRAGGPIDFRRLPYLVNRFEISYALSGTLYSESRSGIHRSRNKDLSFAGFAPVSRELNGRNPRTGETHSTGVAYFGRESLSPFTKQFRALPYSEDEVKSIAREFTLSGRPSRYATGSEATKEEFEADAPGKGVIHIATHGLIDEDSPGRCCPRLFSDTRIEVRVNALLHAGEVYELRLDADLVTLSSCESGVGKLVRGEGLMALTRGFFYAGARNVLCSLWKVYDRQADELMREFYRHVLGGDTYPAALRKAKLKMIANIRSAHPFKWAGFELIGE